jgi:hypothetical protein
MKSMDPTPDQAAMPPFPLDPDWADPAGEADAAEGVAYPVATPAVVDAHELLRDVLQECRGEIAGKKLDVTMRLLARGYRITTDSERLRRVYHHLVKTAIANAPFGGRLTFRSWCPGECSLRLEVEERSAAWAGRSRAASKVLHH